MTNLMQSPRDKAIGEIWAPLLTRQVKGHISPEEAVTLAEKAIKEYDKKAK